MLAGWTAAAAAQDTVLVRVEYRAPSACPERATFLAHVSARTARFRASDAAPRAFLLELSPANGGFEGRLTTVEPSSARATRTLSGDTCEQVVSALALVAALTIESNAPAPAPATPPAAPPPPPSAAPAPAPPLSRPRVWHLEAGLGANMTSAVAPDLLFGLGPFVEGSIDFGSLAPALRLSLQGAPARSSSVEGGGTAAFAWWLATVEGCARWTFAAFGLSPCARVGAGVLRVDGADIAQSRGQARPWVDAGGLLRLRWSPVIKSGGPRPLRAHPGPASFLFLEATGGFVLPITRDRFHFDAPDTTVHRAAPAGGLIGADVGVRFL
jgi:hypothetical protein